jgi:hypothetical protein
MAAFLVAASTPHFEFPASGQHVINKENAIGPSSAPAAKRTSRTATPSLDLWSITSSLKTVSDVMLVRSAGPEADPRRASRPYRPSFDRTVWPALSEFPVLNKARDLSREIKRRKSFQVASLGGRRGGTSCGARRRLWVRFDRCGYVGHTAGVSQKNLTTCCNAQVVRFGPTSNIAGGVTASEKRCSRLPVFALVA